MAQGWISIAAPEPRAGVGRRAQDDLDLARGLDDSPGRPRHLVGQASHQRATRSHPDLRTGEVEWRDRSFAKAKLVHADGRLIVLDEDGNLGMVTVSLKGLEVQARADIFSGRSWTAPTLVGTRLYLRDRKQMMALDLSPS